ncbi:hypothetical protein TNCT_494741 [Trichonephila clavata]|uniref:Uncharacterized protein n=1 Tax=Trichonephila clavata TaxID=2740835 RepID=A0A8X6JRW6_TRICU|nr:hypothetical protein TNCT_494741 [Trichonephila clavata]
MNHVFYASRARRYTSGESGCRARQVYKDRYPNNRLLQHQMFVDIAIYVNMVHCVATCTIRAEDDCRKLSTSKNKSYSSSNPAPDLSSLYFFFWEVMEDHVYKTLSTVKWALLHEWWLQQALSAIFQVFLKMFGDQCNDTVNPVFE